MKLDFDGFDVFFMFFSISFQGNIAWQSMRIFAWNIRMFQDALEMMEVISIISDPEMMQVFTQTQSSEILLTQLLYTYQFRTNQCLH